MVNLRTLLRIIKWIFNTASPHSLTNFEIQKYYENESRFNGVYSRDNLPNSVTYFDSFGVEHIPKEIKTYRQ